MHFKSKRIYSVRNIETWKFFKIKLTQQKTIKKERKTNSTESKSILQFFL